MSFSKGGGGGWSSLAAVPAEPILDLLPERLELNCPQAALEPLPKSAC